MKEFTKGWIVGCVSTAVGGVIGSILSALYF